MRSSAPKSIVRSLSCAAHFESVSTLFTTAPRTRTLPLVSILTGLLKSKTSGDRSSVNSATPLVVAFTVLPVRTQIDPAVRIRVLEHHLADVSDAVQVLERRVAWCCGRELVDDQPVGAVVDTRGRSTATSACRAAGCAGGCARTPRRCPSRRATTRCCARRSAAGDIRPSTPRVLQVLHVRLDEPHRIQRISPAVDHEERLVAKIVREQIAGVDVRAAQHHDVAVERQEARVRRRVAHRDVVRAGAAVGDAGDGDAILVDVVGALDGVENRAEILELRSAPPRRVVPAVRQDVDLLGAGERADACRRRGRRCVSRLTPPCSWMRTW